MQIAKYMNLARLIIVIGVVASCLTTPSIAARQPEVGEVVNGFKLTTVYTDGLDKQVGSRWVSVESGFLVDLLTIQSAPQAFFWIKTPPADDRGEPHTCEHLLLGKGNVGRAVAALEEMTLSNSSAYTDQLVTCYHFNTVAGNDAFFDLFEAKLNALLNPDFSDEEIAREVAHIAVTENTSISRSDDDEGSVHTDQTNALEVAPAADEEALQKKLWIEESGTVYTEMVSSYEKPWSYLWEPMDEMVFGQDHPAANTSGGRPDAIRQMVPKNLRDFHSATHVLSNMGVIAAIPPSITPEKMLAKLSKMIPRVEKNHVPNDHPSIEVMNLPAPQPSDPPGTIRINGYPSENPNDPGEILLSWPATLDYDLEEKFVLDIFLSVLANGSSSLLYTTFFNSATRKMDLGSGYCFGTSSDYPGHPIRIDFGNVDVTNIESTRLKEIRSLTIEQIKSISSMSADSPELKKINDRALSIVTSYRKRYSKVLDTPPQFGFRGGPAGFWHGHLERLESLPSTRKSLTMNDVLDQVEAQLKASPNPWASYIVKWKLLDTEPYIVAIKPDGQALQKIAVDKENRLQAFVDGLKTKYNTTDEQDAIRYYKRQFDDATAVLEGLASKQPYPKFIDNPPLTLDPELDYSILSVNGVKLVASQFDNLTSATFEIALDLSLLPDSLIDNIPLLPHLVNSIGVMHDSKRITHEEMEIKLRREVLSFGANLSTSEVTGRAELMLHAGGSNSQESQAALGWLSDALFHPLIDRENLPRIQDVTAQMLTQQRNQMKGGEEGWVDYPFNALNNQTNLHFLAADCFLTQVHFLQRLKWRLSSPEDPLARAAVLKTLRSVAEAGHNLDRERLTAILSDQKWIALDTVAADVLGDIFEDLQATLPDIPDGSLARDWDYLLGCAVADIGYGVNNTLAELNTTLACVRQRSAARLCLISNEDDREKLIPGFKTLVEKLGNKPRPVGKLLPKPVITTALLERSADKPDLTYLGLVNPDSRNGLIYFGSNLHGSYDASKDAILDALGGKLFGGGGAHGFFMKTWGAGLAYSNGISYRDRKGSVRYYAERCPDIAETMKFVVGLLREAEPNSALLDYVVALAFSESNAPSTYEERGDALAADLQDGFTPEVISNYRKAVLAMRKDPKAAKEIWKRMEKVYGRVLIGYGEKKQVRDGTMLLLIGPEHQIVSMEKLIKATEGEKKVARIFPRDFWIRG